MSPIGFLGLPVTVRNRIYTDLLVPESVPNAKIFHKPVNINILFTNRQIHAESSNIFYSQNLFTLIETNDPGLVFDLPEDHVTIFARNPVNIDSCKRIAMTVEMYLFDNKLSGTSSMYLPNSKSPSSSKFPRICRAKGQNHAMGMHSSQLQLVDQD